METMISLQGGPEHLKYIDEINALGAGVELGSYAIFGIRSEENWNSKFSDHENFVKHFDGKIALHGPFIGIEYNHVDHLIADVVQKRMDMIFGIAKKLNAFRIILHSGYTLEDDVFELDGLWLELTAGFWKKEIVRWREAGIEIMIENVVEKKPGIIAGLLDAVPELGFCLDIGHQNMFSDIPAAEWIRTFGRRLRHVHLHDNDGIRDRHWPMGKGNIDFESFFDALRTHSPDATVCIEVEAEMDVRIGDLRKISEMIK